MNLAMILRAVLPTCAAAAGMTIVSTPATAESRLTIAPATAFAMRAVLAHNHLRTAATVQPAIWDARLAAAADAYAAELARTERFEHSPASNRVEQGENLWMGTRGAFSLEQMIEQWGSEQRMFRPGQFPQVSTTGRWEDVAHYTQIIWPTSARVGCAVRSSAAFDYLVCRYGQSGNVMGAMVGVRQVASR